MMIKPGTLVFANGVRCTILDYSVERREYIVKSADNAEYLVPELEVSLYGKDIAEPEIKPKPKPKWTPPEVAARIVCAANRLDNMVICGARHYDSVMHAQIQVTTESADYWYENKRRVEQGFIDQFGQFYSRTAAWKIATAKGQIIRRCGGDDEDGGTLYSENLY